MNKKINFAWILKTNGLNVYVDVNNFFTNFHENPLKTFIFIEI